ncbi:conserved hypothetical protein [Uncinocarpus reesii 1704]|uniref:Mitochondrial thiamine pyrophosphate carrier 1 n=1 Tax=Uncinocarpus reesii (strain UAMH 1704) TaxID=336963 RepID=C4JHH8_UNCRE|nr:uncharacterized protein UREG_01341 [Uncinocarpus reesii 1704]EEP76492.1 conserved hypothetical protein [Uncinocarpus reesii 1704]
MASLDLLPTELLNLIAQKLHVEHISNLLRTSKRLYNALNDELYREASRRDNDEYGQPVSLIHAASFGEPASFDGLLSRVKDINSPIVDLEGYPSYRLPISKGVTRITILQAVSAMGKENLVELLIAKGVDTEVRDNGQQTALHLAVILKQTAVVKSLIEGGANVLALHGAQNTALVYALQYGSLAIARMLIAAGGANVELPAGPSNPVSQTVAYMDLSLVKQLLETSSAFFPEPCLTDALPSAIKTGNVDIIQYLLDAGAKATPDALSEACAADNLPVIKLLIQAGANVRGRQRTGATALHSVCSFEAAKLLFNEAPDLGRLLAAHQPAVEHVYRTYSLNQNLDIILLVLFLLWKGPRDQDPEDSGNRMRAIHYAAQYGHEAVLRSILAQQKWQVSTLSCTGATALHYAAASTSESRLNCVRLLVEGGVDMAVMDQLGNTALKSVFLNGYHPLNATVAEYLVRAGANPSQRQQNDKSPLHDALYHSDSESALVLIQAGADISAMDPCGMQPLHFAALFGCADIVTELAQRGVNLSARDNRGYTPLHLAISQGFEKYRNREDFLVSVERVITRKYSHAHTSHADPEALRGSRYLAVIKALCYTGANINAQATSMNLSPADFVGMQRFCWNGFARNEGPSTETEQVDETLQSADEVRKIWWKLAEYLNWQRGQRYQVVAAGAIAGLVSRFCVAPLDVVKIRLQLQIHSLSDPLSHRHIHGPVYKGTISTLKAIVREEGITGLWKGNIPAELLYVFYGGIQFTTYRTVTQALHTLPTAHRLPQPAESFLSGAVAGGIATLTTYPFDLLRTRFAAQGNIKIYPSLLSAVRTIHSHEGYPGFFRGASAAVAQIVPYMGLFFATYESVRVPVAQLELPFGSGDATAGVIASVLAKTGVFPLDLVRKRLQVQGPTRSRYIHQNIPEYSGVWSTIKSVVRDGGVRGLYRGLTVSLIKAAPASAVTMWTYERVLKTLKEMNADPVR